MLDPGSRRHGAGAARRRSPPRGSAAFRCASFGRESTFRAGGLVLRALWPPDPGHADARTRTSTPLVLAASYGETDVLPSGRRGVGRHRAPSPRSVRGPQGRPSRLRGSRARRASCASCGRSIAVISVRARERLRASAGRDARRARGLPGLPSIGPTPTAESSSSRTAVELRVDGRPGRVERRGGGPRQARLPADRQRPPEDRDGARPAARALPPEATEVVTRSTRRAPRRSRSAMREVSSATARLVVVEDVDGRSDSDGRRKGGWKAADVDASSLPREPRPGNRARARRRGAQEDDGALEGLREGGCRCSTSTSRRRSCTGGCRAVPPSASVRAEPEACDRADPARRRGPAGARRRDRQARDLGRGRAGRRARGRALVAPTAELPIYELTEAWAGRDTARALAASETLLERESQPRRDTSARLAGALGGHLARLRAVKRLAARGRPSKETAGELRMHPFRAQKLVGQAETFSDGGARRRHHAPCGARRRAQGPEQARARPRASARARRAHAPARARHAAK